MRLSPILLALALSGPAALAASPVDEAARRLDGAWRGDGFSLKVDSRRAQANIDPERPFEWRRFAVKQAEDGEIVFAVGAEIFEAKLAEDSLELTSTSFRGERRLARDEPAAEVDFSDLELRGTTSD
jgi:hypothetical protein